MNSSHDGEEVELPRKKILLVDDDPSIHGLFKEFIRNEPYQLFHLMEGAAAIKTAKEKKPDLILLDVILPFSDGRDICRKLKADSETLDIPVIMVTGRNDYFDRLLGLELGVEEYIEKPCSRMYTWAELKKC